MGLLLDAVLQAAGYFVEQEEPELVAMFVLFTVLTGGVLGWLVKPQGQGWLLVFLGLVLYATVQTIGVFAQQRDWVPALMFSLLTLLTLLAVGLLVRTSELREGDGALVATSTARQRRRKPGHGQHR